MSRPDPSGSDSSASASDPTDAGSPPSSSIDPSQKPATDTRISNSTALSSAYTDTARGAFYALHFRNFRLFFVGQLISVAGTWMQTVAQNWLVWDITHQGRWLGIVSGASAIPYVAFAMWGGHLADRCSRRAVLVWTQSLAMVFAFLFALLATNHPIVLQPWHIAVLAAIGGIINAFNMPAQQAFVTDMVDERSAMSNAIALNSFRFNIARFAGPIFAGMVLTRFGAPVCFFINGLSYIAVVISLLMMRLPPFVPVLRHINIAEGFAYIWRTRAVLRVTTLVGASSIFAWAVSTLFPMISAYFGRGEGGYSAIMALQGVGAAAGAAMLAAFADKLNRRALVYGGAFWFCTLLVLTALSPNFPMALIFLGLAGFAMIVFGMSAQIRIQEEVPDELRGRVLAVYSLVFQGLMPVGGIEMGFMAQHLHRHSLLWLPRAGAQIAIALNALCCLCVTAALYTWSTRDHRQDQVVVIDNE